ncbi:hypothetical protein AAH979_33475 [Plantactinospora sp. ZYX-F-223]|uniref:hypothetical protein n=1 Tax=Plantactinospora sp. ZYX-F-223 TaxID=3144103 RepID=UPI0031FE14EA
MLTSTEPSAPARRSRRAATITRRAGLALGLTAAMSGVAFVGASPAMAAPACGSERAYIHQTPPGGSGGGPSIDSLFNPTEFNISASAASVRNVFLAGVHRPRRSIVFNFYNQDNALIRQYTTTPSDDGGVVRQEQNVIPWDYGVGTRIRFTAVIRTRCGGDDVPKTVNVGSINTVP